MALADADAIIVAAVHITAGPSSLSVVRMATVAGGCFESRLARGSIVYNHGGMLSFALVRPPRGGKRFCGTE